jgi:hypothetical protein
VDVAGDREGVSHVLGSSGGVIGAMLSGGSERNVDSEGRPSGLSSWEGPSSAVQEAWILWLLSDSRQMSSSGDQPPAVSDEPPPTAAWCSIRSTTWGGESSAVAPVGSRARRVADHVRGLGESKGGVELGVMPRREKGKGTGKGRGKVEDGRARVVVALASD